ncbi:MAG: glycerol acyltransferase, partial [Acidobacteriota bacterium]
MLNTPLLTPSLRPLAKLILRILGWKVVGDAPAAPRYVMIAAPHTSNWDGVLLVLMAFVLR